MLLFLFFSFFNKLNFLKRCKTFGSPDNLLQPNGFFHCEDFTRIGNLTNEGSQILEYDVYCKHLPAIDEYKSQLIRGEFQGIKLVDLSDHWKSFIADRLEKFLENKEQLLEIHGDEIYHRLECLHSSITKLFMGERFGGVRIIPPKTASD